MSRQLGLDLGHRASLGREDFLVAPHNEAAVAWIDAWPDWPAAAVALHGPEGCGKTHLASVFAARAQAEFLDPPSIVDALRRVLDGSLRECVVENADGYEDAALLHLLNALAEKGGHALLTARTPPARWNVKLPDLKSRLRAIPAVPISAPGDESLAAILVKLFDDRQLRVEQPVIDWLVSHIERSFDGARRAVAALDAASLEKRREITVALAREILSDRPENA
jgi:chromosomal replication initiation ATPase DnaA